MFDMSQADVEILLQHYGWSGVGDLKKEDDPIWNESEQVASEQMWHKGYGAFVSRDNGIHNQPDREIPLRG